MEPNTSPQSTPEPAPAPGTPAAAGDVLAPDQAAAWLAAAGVPGAAWDKYLERGLGSAELRSFIVIAKGAGPVSLVDTYNALAAKAGEPAADEAMKQRLMQQAAYAQNPL